MNRLKQMDSRYIEFYFYRLVAATPSNLKIMALGVQKAGIPNAVIYLFDQDKKQFLILKHTRDEKPDNKILVECKVPWLRQFPFEKFSPYIFTNNEDRKKKPLLIDIFSHIIYLRKSPLIILAVGYVVAAFAVYLWFHV